LPDVGHATVTRPHHHDEIPMKLSKSVRVDGAESNKCLEPGCNKAFSRRSGRARHTKTHTRPYKCSVSTCLRGFAEIKGLNRHIATHHHIGSLSSLECPFASCSRRFHTERTDNFIRHLVEVHGMSREASRAAFLARHTDGDNNQAPFRELLPPLNSSIHEKSILALQSLDIVPDDDLTGDATHFEDSEPLSFVFPSKDLGRKSLDLNNGQHHTVGSTPNSPIYQDDDPAAVPPIRIPPG